MAIGLFILVSLAGSVVCAALGMVLGARKGHAIAGFLLGLLLGPIGVLIAVILEDKRPKCRKCQYVLGGHMGKRCPKCGAMLERKKFSGTGADPVEQWEARERMRQFRENGE